MNSFIHCVWTGKSFPYALRNFIKEWCLYLRRSRSDFQVILWVSDDSLEVIKSYLSGGLGNSFDDADVKKLIPTLNVDFIKAKIRFNSFYVAKFDALFDPRFSKISEAMQILHDHKYYTSVSNLARVVVINSCGGIYTDVDYLYPNYMYRFPKDMRFILKIFNHSNQFDFYMPVVDLNGRLAVENQCLVLSPNDTGRLHELLAQMNLEISWQFRDIVKAAELNVEYLENEITKSLSRSFFKEGNESSLMEAYKKRNFEEYSHTTQELYKDVYHKKIEIDAPSYFIRPFRISMVDFSGGRHFHYNPISYTTYTSVVNYYLRNISQNGTTYAKKYWDRFSQLFSAHEMHEQFEFKDDEGRQVGLYSWANPGYSRLRKLEKAAGVVEKYFKPEQHSGVLIRLLKRLINDAISSEATKPNKLKDFQELLKKAELPASEKIDVVRAEVIIILKELFVLVREYSDLTQFMTVLNSRKFQSLRTIIDPEKKSFTAEDIEGFLRA